MSMIAIIVPSKNPDNAIRCFSAIREHEPCTRIICVDDGAGEQAMSVYSPSESMVWIKGESPFIFARNVNKGIAAAGGDDVIICNDDALLMTPGGFTDMAIAAEKNPEYGVISASISGFVGNRNQVHTGIGGLRDEPRMVCFIAALIRRNVIEQVGLLDEDFVGYGFDDDSYCLRARRAGYKIGVFDGCVVQHGTLPSTFRSRPDALALFQQNDKVFRAKHGAGNHQL